MDNQEIEIELIEEPLEFELENSNIVNKGKIDSISVNGIPQEIDENKNVDIIVPTQISDLQNDSDFVEDENYVHTDNNYTTEEKTKLASLENYDDTEIKGDITSLQTNKADKSEIPTTLAELTDDSTHRLVTDTDKTTWNNKSNFSGSYNDLTNKPTIPDDLADLNDDSTHRLVTDTEKTTWNAKYDKPSSGIPSTDMSSAVQTSLGKADTAIQDISGKQDIIDSSHKLNADLVDDTNSTNKFVTASDIVNWNSKASQSSVNELAQLIGTLNESLENTLAGGGSE